MLPALPPFYLANGLCVDRVIISNGFVGARILSNMAHIVFRQLTVLVGTAKKKVLAVASHHVGIVVSVCPKIEMIRTATRRVIAVVQDQHSIWNGAFQSAPHRAVGGRLLSFKTRDSIPAFVCDACPSPASIRLLADPRNQSLPIHDPSFFSPSSANHVDRIDTHLVAADNEDAGAFGNLAHNRFPHSAAGKGLLPINLDAGVFAGGRADPLPTASLGQLDVRSEALQNRRAGHWYSPFCVRCQDPHNSEATFGRQLFGGKHA